MAAKSKLKKIDAEKEDAESKNKRGRPRVESQDQSAAERRRTQIRLAQRAYRERKETTIGVLKKVVRDMNKAFVEFSEKTTATTGTLPSTFLQDLQQTSERFAELYQRAGLDEDDFSGTFSSISTNSRHSSVSQSKSISPPTLAVHTSNYTEPTMIDSRHGINASSLGMLGYEFDYSEAAPVIMEDITMNHTQNWTDPWAVGQTGAADYHQMNAGRLSPLTSNLKFAISASLQGPESYASQETSFARRLLRHSHELCYKMLTIPSHEKPDAATCRARYSLSFMSTKDLIAKLIMTSKKTTYETLEDWSLPMLHVGGAGLHFERDANEKEPPAGFTTERNTGPFKIPAAAALKVPPIYFPDKVAAWLGLEGTWLDNRDVEVYLKRKGVLVDGSSCNTIIEIESLSESSSPTNTESSAGILDERPIVVPDHGQIVTSENQQLTTGFEALMGSDVSNKRRQVEVSLDDLVTKLNDKCYCLGRAPGYKQTHVDEALREVVLEALALQEYSHEAPTYFDNAAMMGFDVVSSAIPVP